MKESISRRQFLKNAAMTSAVIGFPVIVPAEVVARKGARRLMPNDRINLGQIGCGSIANYMHWGALKAMDDVRVVATCDAYKSRREAMAALYNKHYGSSEITRAHADFRQVLARPDVDAVIIAAHDNWHTPMSIAAVNAGKDVYCQKPLALNFSLTGILRKAVARKGRVFQFGTQYRSERMYRHMVEVVRNGYIGELQHMDVWCRNVHWDAGQYHVRPYGSSEEAPVPADLDLDAWQGPSPMAPYTVDRCTNWGGYHCPETSLGFIAGCGIHPLGIAQWGNKADDTSPVRYEGTGNIPTQGIYRTLERWDVLCQYANGVTLRLMDCDAAKPVVTKYAPQWGGGDGVVFHGTKGWIGNVCARFCASDEDLWTVKFKDSEEQLPLSNDHHRNFIDSVRSRQQPICPVEMAIRCDTICHLARAAALTGKVVNWDPRKEKIGGDNPAAAKMLSLPYRKKWKVW